VLDWALLGGTSTSSLDSMLWRERIIQALAVVLSTTVVASTPADRSQATLRTLASSFSQARALPPGSRPGPPRIELRPMLGLASSSIRAALGAPESDDKESASDCHAAFCWVYRYGPGPAPIPPPSKTADGGSEITVSTGGPFLLILGFSEDHLVSARWLGQR
jgi:hypothetical protein